MPLLIEDEQIHLAALAISAELAIEEQDRAYELRLMALAGCTMAEARYMMRADRVN